MSRFRIAFSSMLAFACVLLVALGMHGHAAAAPLPATHTYPGCGATLQTCINSASPGETISIAPGTYNESFTLDKPVSLIGADASTTVFNALASQRVVTVTGAS